MPTGYPFPIHLSAHTDDARLTEIEYHRKLNRWMALLGSPPFIFFALFHYHHGNLLQSFFFLLLSLNAIGAVLLGLRISELHRLVLLKRITSSLAFGLMAASFFCGMLAGDIYIFTPWIYCYPIAVMLFFGHKAGFICALLFSTVMVAILITLDLPLLSEWDQRMFRLNNSLALLFTLATALISERTRVRVQNQLVGAQNEALLAEKRQRQANMELQREIELRSQSEKELAQSELRYRALFEESAVSLWEEDWSRLKMYLDELPPEDADDLPGYFKAHPAVLDECINLMQVTAVNRSTLHLFETQNSATLMKNLSAILPVDRDDYFLNRIIGLYNNNRYSAEGVGCTLRGRHLSLLISSTVPAGFEESWQRVFTSVSDLTDRVAMEEERKRVAQQLQHGRQIQAIATLAGGIAHQFNNALAIILGNLDLLKLAKANDPQNDPYLSSLRTSTDRMCRLTDQLLAYARGGKYQPQPFSANNLIQDVMASERLALPPSITIRLQLDENVCLTNGDITQIKTVLEAVLSNAAESMNAGGEVTVSTSNQFFKEGAEPVGGVLPAPGEYAVISIQDTGVGMDEATCRRIFEPFFTTKFVGRGLGMAAAFGIIKNHDGMIMVQSEPKKGTRVLICLPRFEALAKPSLPRSRSAA